MGLCHTVSEMVCSSLFILTNAATKLCERMMLSNDAILERISSQSVLTDDFTAPSKDISILKKRTSACSRENSCNLVSLVAVLMNPSSRPWPALCCCSEGDAMKRLSSVVSTIIQSDP